MYFCDPQQSFYVMLQRAKKRGIVNNLFYVLVTDCFIMNSKFLLTPDPETNELFLIHKQHPACLIKIIDTKPIILRIVDMFEEIEEGEILEYSFLEDAKHFLRRALTEQMI